jgi:uncharacterized protein YggT (Ycf19 family)
MALYQEVRTVEPVATTTNGYHDNLAARLIYLVGGIIIALLALRFVFAMLGANPNNGIANFVYTVSHPFAAPFFSLFSYNQTLGSSKFEFTTLVAIVIYALIMALLARLVTLGNRRTVA